MNQFNELVEDYSEQYFLMPDIEVREYSGTQVAVSDDLMHEMGRYVTAPLIKLPTGHYWPHTEWGIPADTIAVPHEHRPADMADQPLLAKDLTTKTLLNKGVVEQP